MSSLAPPLSFNPAGIELDRRQGLTRQLYEALRQRVLRQPLSFVLPIRLKPPPGADSVPAAPPHDDGDSHSPKPPG